MNQDKVFNIEFKGILKAVTRRFYIVILITLPVLALSVYYGYNSVRITYNLSANIILGSSSNNNTEELSIMDVSQVQGFMLTYSAIAKTTAVADKTIKRLNLNISSDRLKSSITAIPQEGTPFIELRLVWPNSKEAMAILEVLTEVYIQEARSILPMYRMRVMEKSENPQAIVTSNKTMYTALGLSAGIICSLLLIFALEFMNTRLRSEEDVEKSLGLPILGLIPKQKKKMQGIYPESIRKLDRAVIEAYRTLRTNVHFTAILKNANPFVKSFDRGSRTIAVTSGMLGEGKTSVASMLAVLMAQEGKKTILVDCNLRNPDIHNVFNLHKTGLSETLYKEIKWKGQLHISKIENLHIITAGVVTPEMVELLSSVKMKELFESLRREYEYIIIDTPPVNLFSDAQIISPYVDGYLLVISYNQSKSEDAIKAQNLIKYADGKILGVVLNRLIDQRIYRHYKSHYKKAEKTESLLNSIRKEHIQTNMMCNTANSNLEMEEDMALY